MASSWSLREAARPGLLAVRNYYRVFLFFQAIAIGLYFAYYRIPSVQGAVDIFAADNLGDDPYEPDVEDILVRGNTVVRGAMPSSDPARNIIVE